MSSIFLLASSGVELLMVTRDGNANMNLYPTDLARADQGSDRGIRGGTITYLLAQTFLADERLSHSQLITYCNRASTD
jgi:hypothetical protein